MILTCSKTSKMLSFFLENGDGTFKVAGNGAFGKYDFRGDSDGVGGGVDFPLFFHFFFGFFSFSGAGSSSFPLRKVPIMFACSVLP